MVKKAHFRHLISSPAAVSHHVRKFDSVPIAVGLSPVNGEIVLIVSFPLPVSVMFFV